MRETFGKACTALRNWLLAPFEKEFPFFVLLLVICSLFDITQFLQNHNYLYTIYVVALFYLLAYGISLIVCLFPKGIIRNILKIAVIVPLVIQFIIELYCKTTLSTKFSKDFAGAILGTNKNEALEFLQSFVGPVSIIYTLGPILILLFLYAIFHRIKFRLTRALSHLALIFAIISLFLFIKNPSVWCDTIIERVAWYFKIQSPPDLHEYLTHPNLTIEKSAAPQTLTIIFGESFARSHSSLYNYEKETNPKIEQFLQSGNLFVFSDITSVATLTVPSFKNMMSTYKTEYGESPQWYTYTSILEVMHLAGYYETWISNQSKTGFHDNMIGKYADLCDTCAFVGNKFVGTARCNLDGEVSKLAKNIVKHHDKEFYVFHLMGSHPGFFQRYPKSFGHFKAQDYADKPENQRQTLAEYDNSVLYNDSVVSEIIKLFKERDAIVVYLSDHGMDIFNSRPDYAAHGQMENPISRKYGTEIPFMIYTSPLYKEKHPEMVERIKANQNRKFRTDDLIYTIMDIAGCDFEDGSVKKYSLLRMGE